LTEEARGGLLEEALEHALIACAPAAGVAFSAQPGLELVAERGFGEGTREPDALRAALRVVATNAMATRKVLHVQDLTRPDQLEMDVRQELGKRGWRAIAAVPVKHLREVAGVLVVVSKDPILLDLPAVSVLETMAHLVALAIERDRRIERELAYRSELAEVGHMASLGLLTATVAHELRGPVSALLVQIDEQQRLLERLRDSAVEADDPLVSELAELLTETKAASGQINAVVGQLAALSRRDSAPDQVDLSAIAQEGLLLARSELKRQGIELVEDYAPGCLTTGRRDNLVQVVLNLLFNAIEACAAAGFGAPKITVRTRTDSARVMLSIDDTGASVADGDIKAMFQPFFTGKHRARGGGLGLKICSDVVTAHHGHIEVVGLEDRGASFRVFLPRAAGPAEEAPDSKREPLSSRRSTENVERRRVFVVDDDELFTRTIKRALRPHDVQASATASEAEIALLDPKYVPDLVLCDLGLPGFGGDVLHARIKAKRPRIAERFVFVTGGACTKQEADYLRSSGCPTLLKPVDVNDIWGALAAPQPPISVVPEGLATLRSEPPPSSRSESPTLPPTAKQS
jgi:signal transduction histidine kinase/ActR/RegA family two-component response regulator